MIKYDLGMLRSCFDCTNSSNMIKDDLGMLVHQFLKYDQI
jgi:hypothetical protein